MSTIIVTGSAGLVGSEAVRRFAALGHRVVGIDNDTRALFFGEHGSTLSEMRRLSEIQNYEHCAVDIRDLDSVVGAFNGEDIAAVIHTAAQPSHDWAATHPLIDFGVNAIGTMNLLETMRVYTPEAPFIFTSTNKVYGDSVNRLPLTENETRYTCKVLDGIDESFSIDQTMHSLFGASKVAADVMVQEYGRYFGMNTVCFRCGCITGPGHAGVPQHGFLSYLVKCAMSGTPYQVIGHKGKQVRDNIHATDLVSAFVEYVKAPRPGAVYNIGGGPDRSCSVREAIAMVERISGRKMVTEYVDEPRKGDHIWWISDNWKFQRDYPAWSQKYTLEDTIREIINAHSRTKAA